MLRGDFGPARRPAVLRGVAAVAKLALLRRSSASSGMPIQLPSVMIRLTGSSVSHE
jgi:hypothetical protein